MTPSSWINESSSISRSNAYLNSNGLKIRTNDKLGNRHLEQNQNPMLVRLQLAAAPLADLLDEILDLNVL
mgnify:CR=1 FL=1